MSFRLADPRTNPPISRHLKFEERFYSEAHRAVPDVSGNMSREENTRREDPK